jgi:predicted metal-binding membrane protein
LTVVGAYQRRGHRSSALTAAFGAGYLSAWTGFSAAAATTQLALHRMAVLSQDMASRSAIVGGALLILAGAYQWLPFKTACLTYCRSPLAFLASEWREGAGGAFQMGATHGLYCVGCCWALMTLLFVAGVMNLLWVGAIAAFVLLEKLAPHGAGIGRAAGLFLVAWGVWMLAHGV